MTLIRYGDNSRHPDNTALYGAPGVTYGDCVLTSRRLTWGISVDWDGDGLLTGENEVVGLFDLETSLGRQNFMRGGSDGFFPVDIGTLELAYRNDSGRYDPYNTASPLYGKLVPGRLIVVVVKDETTGTIYPVFKGRLKDIRPVYGETEVVRISAVDGVQELQRMNVRTQVQTNIRYNTALALLLAEAGWAHGSVIDTTVSDTMPYYWASGDSLKDELQALVDAVLGLMWVDEEGKFNYLSRVGGDSPLVSLTGADVDRDYGVRAPVPQDVVRNRIRVFSRTRTAHTNVDLWQARDVFLIPAGESREVWASHSYNGMETVATGVTAPVATTDYLANEQADGSGANLTGNITIAVDDFSTATKLTVTNTGGSDAYMTLLKLRGNAITPDEYTFVEDSDPTSIQDYGDNLFVVASDWLQDVNTARDQAALLTLRLATARRFPRVRLKPNPALQFNLALFKLAQVDIASKGVSGEFRAGYIHHKWIDEVGQTVRTEVFFEPNLMGATSGTWIFPAVFDVSTIF